MKSGPIRRDDGEGGRLIAVYVVSGSDEVYRDWDYIQLALVEAQKEHVRKDHPLGTG